MEKDDQVSFWRPTKVIGHVLVGGLFGLVCAVLPFSLGLSRTKGRLSPIPKLPPGAEDPVRLGIKALIWGSIYSVGGVGALTCGVCWILDVKNFSDFGKRMRTSLPPKVYKIRQAIPKIRQRHHTVTSVDNDVTNTPNR